MTPELIEALKANTEAMTRLAVVWEKLHAKAKAIEANPNSTGIQAAGVPLAVFPTKHADVPPAGGFVL